MMKVLVFRSKQEPFLLAATLDPMALILPRQQGPWLFHQRMPLARFAGTHLSRAEAEISQFGFYLQRTDQPATHPIILPPDESDDALAERQGDDPSVTSRESAPPERITGTMVVGMSEQAPARTMVLKKRVGSARRQASSRRSDPPSEVWSS